MTAIIKNVKNRNFSKTQGFDKFPKCLNIWEISQIPTDISERYIFKILEISEMTGNFQDTQAFGKFPKIPRHFRNFPNTQIFGEFLKCLGFWETFQISFEKFPKS